jgi:hypothetical protein
MVSILFDFGETYRLSLILEYLLYSKSEDEILIIYFKYTIINMYTLMRNVQNKYQR